MAIISFLIWLLRIITSLEIVIIRERKHKEKKKGKLRFALYEAYLLLKAYGISVMKFLHLSKLNGVDIVKNYLIKLRSSQCWNYLCKE